MSPSALRFDRYRPAEARRLRALTRTDQWRRVLDDGPFLAHCAGDRVPASSPPSQLRGVPGFLIRANGEHVRALVAQGVADETTLARALGDWRRALDAEPRHPLLFLGMTVTLDCSFKPRCLYCNQAHADTLLGVADWKRLIEEAAIPDPPYVYISGGEPLLLGEAIWGDDGLAAHAARLGCAVNINTNAALISPLVAMRIVKSGVSRIHVSLDAADPGIQEILFRRPARVGAVWRGIRNVLIAREALQSDHPRIHINCVMTKLNLDSVPALLQAVWSMRPVAPGGAGSLDDFAFHLIPVGGRSNAHLRPSAEQWRRFYTDTWEEAGRAWQSEQASAGVVEADRQPLEAVVPFANPFLRVDHHMALDEYCELAAQGIYWQGALCDACWVAPTQAYVLPDGSQHWCGGHAIRRPEPMGDVREAGLRANIRAGVERLGRLPGPECAGCAGATCVINQSTLAALRVHVRELLDAHRSPAPAP